MKTKLRTIFCMIAAAMFLFGAAACGSVQKEDGGDTGTQTGERVTYTITVQSRSGVPIEGVSVAASLDGKVKNTRKTDSYGMVNITLPSAPYSLSFDDLPNGYSVGSEYVTDREGSPVKVLLDSAPIAREMPKNTVYKVGSVVYDFTYTDASTEEEKTLSDILKTHDAVMLNFWYSNCIPCRNEFPYIESAYQKYSDSIVVVAINDKVSDKGYTLSDVASFRMAMGASFDFTIETEISSALGITTYPVNVLIDRYGVICKIVSSFSNEEEVSELFEKYCA